MKAITGVVVQACRFSWIWQLANTDGWSLTLLLRNSDKLQTCMVWYIHVPYSAYKMGGVFVDKNEAELQSTMNVQDFPAPPDVNQGGLSVSNTKLLLNFRGYFWLCQKMAFWGVNGEYNLRRAGEMQQRLGRQQANHWQATIAVFRESPDQLRKSLIIRLAVA